MVSGQGDSQARRGLLHLQNYAVRIVNRALNRNAALVLKSVSHELPTPLANHSTLIYCNDIARSGALQKDQRDKIKQSSSRFYRLTYSNLFF
jgi:K+-sensing histidine kinase KdpD